MNQPQIIILVGAAILAASLLYIVFMVRVIREAQRQIAINLAISMQRGTDLATQPLDEYQQGNPRIPSQIPFIPQFSGIETPFVDIVGAQEAINSLRE
jgi:hypothetical protein